MSEPRIYTKSFINSNSLFDSSHGDTVIQRICDRDKVSKWVSEGADSDGTEITLAATFIEGGEIVQKTIGYVILVNHNLSNPTIEYFDGSTWVELDSATGVVDGTSVFSFGEVTCEQVRVRVDHTQVAHQEKYIGEFIACAGVLVPSKDLVGYDVQMVQRKAYELQLADGSVQKTTVMFSVNRSSKYEANVRFDFLTVDELEVLQAYRDTAQAFLWQPESETRPDEIYLVNWAGNGFKQQYVSTYKGAGYRVELMLKEV